MTDIMSTNNSTLTFQPLENLVSKPLNSTGCNNLLSNVDTLQDSLHILLTYLDHEEEDDIVHYNMVRKLYPYAIIGNITHLEFIKMNQKLTSFINNLGVNEDIYEAWRDVLESFNQLPFCDEEGNAVLNTEEILDDDEDDEDNVSEKND